MCKVQSSIPSIAPYSNLPFLVGFRKGLFEIWKLALTNWPSWVFFPWLTLLWANETLVFEVYTTAYRKSLPINSHTIFFFISRKETLVRCGKLLHLIFWLSIQILEIRNASKNFTCLWVFSLGTSPCVAKAAGAEMVPIWGFNSLAPSHRNYNLPCLWRSLP